MSSLLLAAALAGWQEPPPDPAAMRGLEWLVANACGAGWQKEPGTEGSKRLFASIAAGYAALLLAPAEPGPELQAAVTDWTAVVHAAGGRVHEVAQVNWLEGIRALWCAEWSARNERAHPLLARIARGFAARQNREGGWCHGEGATVDFYPSTLIATTNLALLALGTAERFGVSLDREACERGLELLAAVQAPSGGFAYGGRDYRKGVEAGRTCGTVVALAAMQRQQDRGFALAAAYLRRNRSRIPDGHASPALHVLFGALASHVLGPDDWRDYDAQVLARVRAAQREDGSFADIVTGSPDSMRILGDDRTNSAYLTALYTAALATPRSRMVAAWSSGPVLPVLPAVSAPPPPEVAWSCELPKVRAIADGGDRIAVLTAEGVHWLDPASGAKLAHSAVQVDATGPLAMACAGSELVIANREGPAQTIAGQLAQARTAANPVACFDAASGDARWRAVVPFAVADLRLVPGGTCLLGVTGRCLVLDRDTGREVSDRDPMGVGVNAHWLVGPGFRVLTGEHRLVQFGEDGKERWSRRLRAPRGLTPAACCSLAVTGEVLHVGTTAGVVQRRRLHDGELLDEATLGSAPALLATSGDLVLALTEGGQVYALHEGREVWQQDATQGAEGERSPVLLVAGGKAVAGNAGVLALLDVDGGRILRRFALPPGARCLLGTHLVVAVPGERDRVEGWWLRPR